MRPWIAVLFVVLAFAGCADEPSHTHIVTCDDGTEHDYSDNPHHDDQDFDPASLCAPPPLVVALTGAPESIQVFDTATLTFDLPLGGHASAHSMDNQVRAATEEGAPGAADGPDTFGEPVARREHQDLPLSFEASFTPSMAGTYYLRGVALVDGEHIWSEPVTIEVTPVAPTGTEHVIAQAMGDFLGGIAPAQVDAALGDALVFQNDDLREHVFTFASGPLAGVEVTVAAGATSQPILLDLPATHEVRVDNLQESGAVQVRVA